MIVRYLDFAEASTEECLGYCTDVILVADCTYSEDIITHLVCVLQKFLVSAPSYSERSDVAHIGSMDFKLPFCLLAGTVWAETTYQHLLNTLDNESTLHYKDVTDWAVRWAGPQSFRYQNRDSIRIFVITG